MASDIYRETEKGDTTMKQSLATIAAMLFAGSLQAASDVDVYHGFAAGNPDLSSDAHSVRTTDVAMIGAQPTIGSGARGFGSDPFSQRSIYNGFEMGNPDL